MRRILPEKHNKGFTTIYLLLILSTLVISIVMMINATCARAGRSIVDSVCATAGRSVLSEYQNELFERYGIFAVRADDAMLSRLSKFYVAGSLINTRALVQPQLVSLDASCEAYPGLDVEMFGKQVRRLAPGALLTKGGVIEYILNAGGSSDGFDEDAGGISSGQEDIEVEDPQKEAEKAFNKDKGKNGEVTLSAREFSQLPSSLLGYKSRKSLLLSGGISDLSFSAVAEDEYILALCSNGADDGKDTFLKYEVEYILYGNRSDKANLRSVKLSLFAVRFAVNEAKYYAETGELLSATAAAVGQAVLEVRTLLSGGSVDHLDYKMYLRILLALLPRKEKLARLMDIMQLNISRIDKANFAFKNYAYGFDLKASFVLKKRAGDVEQTFTYR